jgi:NAD(P)-dependent dehydrogenase (short-subunit alcohol dehydrogenase family)
MKNVHIITGGSSGIGLECAKRFKDGIVLITARNEERLKNAEAELIKEGIDARYKTSDASKRESLKELFEYAKSLGKIKTIVNSAGVSGGSADAKLTLEIDLLGVENIIQETLKVIEDKTVLILISSMMGHVVPPNPQYDGFLSDPSKDGAIDALVQMAQNQADIAYNFSKRGTLLLVKKYAMAFGEKGARINSVSPGIIMTPMGEQAALDHPERMNYMKTMTPMSRNGHPDDIANAVEFLADDKASFITGTDLLVDGGLVISLPEIARKFAEQ